MKPQNPTAQNKKNTRGRRKSREEINQEARDRKRDKKHRGNAPGSRGGEHPHTQNSKGNKPSQDPRIGSKKPVELGSVSTPVVRSVKAKVEKPAPLSPEAELALLENDDRLDGLLERVEQGETLSKEDQVWVDATLDRIDELMEQLGISYEDDEQDEEKTDDLMRLLKGS